MPRWLALNRYWGECPPTHLLVAGFVGYKPKNTKSVNSPEELAAMFGMLRKE